MFCITVLYKVNKCWYNFNKNCLYLDRLGEPSLVLILKWGGELTPAGRIQAEELGRIFRCMYPGGQGRHLSGSYHALCFFAQIFK